MVYTRHVDDQTLNFAVSGMLWNRSLIMIDKETDTLWSHILGKAMKGKLKGAQLTAIPSTMVTWRAWQKEHPKTTVIKLPRTSQNYVTDYYRNPKSFVLGWKQGSQAYSIGFDSLLERPLINIGEGKSSLVLTFDRESTAANLFSSHIDGETLQFELVSPGRMKDKQTQSVWNSQTGVAVEGSLKGETLKPHVGIVSFVSVWKKFHPDNRVIQP